MKRILVTAIGSFSGHATITRLKDLGYYVTGCDFNERILLADSVLVDSFYRVCPATRTQEYIESICRICAEEKTDAIIPLTDPEVDVLCAYRDRIPARVLISDTDSVMNCRDKYLTYQKLAACPDVDLIATRLLTRGTDPVFPSIIKPRSGRSSQGCKRLNDIREYSALIFNDDEYVIQPYIEGSVTAVDVVRIKTADGSQTVAVPREELLRTERGAGLSVRVFSDAALEEMCRKIADILDITGCVCFEFIKSADGRYHFLECNPRFSAGIAFTLQAGYDCVGNHIRCFECDGIETFELKKEMFFARYYQVVQTK